LALLKFIQVPKIVLNKGIQHGLGILLPDQIVEKLIFEENSFILVKFVGKTPFISTTHLFYPVFGKDSCAHPTLSTQDIVNGKVGLRELCGGGRGWKKNRYKKPKKGVCERV
jgi:hypothetical protein